MLPARSQLLVVGKQAVAVEAAQLLQRLVLDLADALAADLQLLADLGQGVLVCWCAGVLVTGAAIAAPVGYALWSERDLVPAAGSAPDKQTIVDVAERVRERFEEQRERAVGEMGQDDDPGVPRQGEGQACF